MSPVPKAVNYRGDKAGAYLMWCDIIDPQAVLDLLENGHTPLLVCIPSLKRYTTDPLYQRAVDAYNAEIVRTALRGEEEEECTE